MLEKVMDKREIHAMDKAIQIHLNLLIRTSRIEIGYYYSKMLMIEEKGIFELTLNWSEKATSNEFLMR